MGSESPVIDREEIEQTLCQITEIEAVRVVSDGDNLIQELHVLASGHRAPRQIVRDIESLLMARFSIPVDHKKISIAQIQTSESSPKGREMGRLKISGIVIEINDCEASVEVRLTRNGEQISGAAKGQSSQNSRLRLVASATLEAAQNAAGGNLRFGLEHLSIIPAGADRVALACVSTVTRAGEQTYSGSAIVTTNDDDAVVRSTLAAINRHLGAN